VPHERAWNVGLRTLHLMAFGVLLGGHFWDVQAELLLPALAMTVASGAALMGLELYKSFYWLFLGKGLMVLAKLVLLLSVLLFWEARVPLLFAVVALASIGAHMPARFRYYSVLHRRVLETEPPPLLIAERSSAREEGVRVREPVSPAGPGPSTSAGGSSRSRCR